MSEAELHVLRARLRGGIISKARRGELEIRLPIGFVYDPRVACVWIPMPAFRRAFGSCSERSSGPAQRWRR